MVLLSAGRKQAQIKAFAVVCFFGLLGRPATAASCDGDCQLQQRESLQTFYNALSGPNWTTSRYWNTSTGATSGVLPAHCDWDGISCCSNGIARLIYDYTPPLELLCTTELSVVGIRLPVKGLQGILPAGYSVWQHLSSLLWIELSGAEASIPCLLLDVSTDICPCLSPCLSRQWHWRGNDHFAKPTFPSRLTCLHCSWQVTK